MKIALLNHGCAKNLVDSELMLGLLAEKGYEVSLDENDADIIVINTCSFIHDAEKESVQAILQMVQDGKKVIVTGCLPQKYKGELKKAIPEIAGMIGTSDIKEIVEVVDNVANHKKYVSMVSEKPEYIYPESSITCGITALCILLGYFDTYHNDNFIPGDNYIFKDSIISESPDDILNWKISSISVKYSFHKLLFDNYMHYNSLIGDIEFIGGYPMADAELKETMIDYLANETDIPSSQIQHHSGAVFFTHQKPRSLLQNNIPVILVLSKYPYQKNSSGDKSDKAWHNVVAYGYNEASDTFIVNYGWAPINGTNYNKIILKDYSVYGYYAMEYSGPHVHSKNGIGYHYFSILDTNFIGTYNICGCTHCEFDDFITL